MWKWKLDTRELLLIILEWSGFRESAALVGLVSVNIWLAQHWHFLKLKRCFSLLICGVFFLYLFLSLSDPCFEVFSLTFFLFNFLWKQCRFCYILDISFFYFNKVIDFHFSFSFYLCFWLFFLGSECVAHYFFLFIDRAVVGFYMRSGRIFDLSASLAYRRLSNFCRIL